MYEIEVMTLQEYYFRMKAFELKNIDKQYWAYLQAWINQQATATKRQGKKEVPYFRSFKDFFDYEKELNKSMNKPDPKKNIRLDKIAELNGG